MLENVGIQLTKNKCAKIYCSFTTEQPKLKKKKKKKKTLVPVRCIQTFNTGMQVRKRKTNYEDSNVAVCSRKH